MGLFGMSRPTLSCADFTALMPLMLDRAFGRELIILRNNAATQL